MRGIQQSPSLWAETYWHRDVLFLDLDQFSITYRGGNPRNAQCIQSNCVSKCEISWDVLIAITLSGCHILQKGWTSLFSMTSFISFFLPMTVVKTFFPKIHLCLGYFATSWDWVQWPGARFMPSWSQVMHNIIRVYRRTWWWTNLPHPPSQFTHAWSEGWPQGAAWKAP